MLGAVSTQRAMDDEFDSGGPLFAGFDQLLTQVAATLTRGDVERHQIGPAALGEERRGGVGL